MNERIRELVLQSGGEFWQRLENDVVKEKAYITFDPPESLEKFAELIVQECMSICKKQVAGAVGTYAGVHNNAVGACVKGIKEHFRVE